MTKKTTVCCLCGNEHEYSSYVSLYISGPIDLDGSGGIHSYIGKIMRCEHCGYCSENLANFIEGAKEIIQTEKYKKQLNNPENPEYVNSFLCYSILCENVGDYFKCGLNNLKVAWEFDYKDIPKKYIEHRLKALSYFEKDIQKLYDLFDNDGTGKIIHIDLLRRTRQFDKAMEVFEQVKDTISLQETEKIKDMEEILNILNIEKFLIINNDDGRYDTYGNKNNHTEAECHRLSKQREQEREQEKLKKQSIFKKIIKKIMGRFYS